VLTAKLVAWLVITVVAFLVVGVTVTIGVLLLLLVPAALLASSPYGHMGHERL
jgi:hypothetical protein